MDGVVSVLPNTKFQPHTTRSWDFMGLTRNLSLRYPNQGNVIVGVLDTGKKFTLFFNCLNIFVIFVIVNV